jgi:site-specific DNA recombinase
VPVPISPEEWPVSASACSPVPYVALYCRISKDPSGRVENVRDQEQWGRAYATKVWPDLPVVVFSDNNLSAAKDDTWRPEFEKLRACILAGEVAHLWSVEQSRLERRKVEWFQFETQLASAEIAEVHTRRDGVVRVGSEVAGIKAVLNANEISKMIARVKDKLERNAEKGIPPGGAVFGYRRGMVAGRKTLVIVDAEAQIIQRAAAEVLSGRSLASIARELNENGVQNRPRRRRGASGEILTVGDVPLQEGGEVLTYCPKITPRTVRGWLTNAVVAGVRVHCGVAIGPGNWQPILDAPVAIAVKARLEGNRVVVGNSGTEYPVKIERKAVARRYLLTGGIAQCGECGFKVVASVRKLRGKEAAHYMCHVRGGGPGCVAILAEPFERDVTERLFAELFNPRFTTALTADEYAAQRGELIADLDAIDRKQVDLAQRWATGDLPEAAWDAARAKLAERQQRLRADLSSLPLPAADVDPVALRAAWDSMDLGRRREVVSMFIEHVVISKPAPRAPRRYDGGRVEIVWR